MPANPPEDKPSWTLKKNQLMRPLIFRHSNATLYVFSGTDLWIKLTQLKKKKKNSCVSQSGRTQQKKDPKNRFVNPKIAMNDPFQCLLINTDIDYVAIIATSTCFMPDTATHTTRKNKKKTSCESSNDSHNLKTLKKNVVCTKNRAHNKKMI